MPGSSSSTSVIVYITHPLPENTQSWLIRELNRPATQPGVLQLSSESLSEASLEDVAEVHKQWMDQNMSNYGHGLFVVADEGMAPAAHPKTVLVVKGPPERHPPQPIRTLVANVARVIDAIDNGEHTWDEFWEVAAENGGHYPGE